MTFNPLMLPVLPPTSAVGSKAAFDTGSAALKSSRLSQSAKGRQSFLDTLNHISLPQYNRHHNSTCAKSRTENSAGLAKEPSDNNGKTSNPNYNSPAQIQETEPKAAAKAALIFDRSQAFGMIHLRCFGFFPAGNGSFSNETPSETPDGASSIFPHKLMGCVQPQGKGSLIDWLVGIGPIEQLQPNISPEAGNRYLVEQLAAEYTVNQGSGDMMGIPTEFTGIWHWRAFSAEAASNNPAASLWGNRDILLEALLQMQQDAAAASGSNADAFGTAGQNAPVYLETILSNEDLFAKMTLRSLSKESGLSENTKGAENANGVGSGKDAPMQFWATTDPNSQTFLETPSRLQTENSPFFKMTADLKATAEQAANSNIVTEGIPGKPAGDGFRLNDPVLKAEGLTVAELGSKTVQIEGDTKDGGFMFAQGQMPDHLKTLPNASSSLSEAQRGLASQAMDQIVQKAVLLLNNDQQEVRIELKPEFLGHIRMQIVTESQQVAIKIVAEFPFVKDMLENNLHQLKAVLQAQGLDIEELEVSVAHDSHAQGDTHQSAEVSKDRAIRNDVEFDDGSSKEPSQTPSQGGGAMAETAIDYFA